MPIHLIDPTELVRRMKEKNILIGSPAGNRIRVVTHKNISRVDILLTIRSHEKHFKL